MFFTLYKEYEYTYVREARIKKSSELAKTQLTKELYNALKRESQDKVDRVAKEIRAELLEKYNSNLGQFAKDYEYPVEGTILVDTIDKKIHSEENRFFHIESDANDMFVMSDRGIVSDKSQECAKFGITRDFKQETSMHYNRILANEAIKSILAKDNKDVFWQFRKADKILLTEMDIDKVLNLSVDELKSYEFLSVAYIDRYNDILGVPDVTTTGYKKDNKKLIVVQGFSLYEHIQQDFKSGYVTIDKNTETQLKVVAESRRGLTVELFLTLAIIFTSLFSIASLQNSFKKGCGDSDKHR